MSRIFRKKLIEVALPSEAIKFGNTNPRGLLP
jgi:hypothetical protein